MQRAHLICLGTFQNTCQKADYGGLSIGLDFGVCLVYAQKGLEWAITVTIVDDS